MQSHPGRTMAGIQDTSPLCLPALHWHCGLPMAPLSLFVQQPDCATRKEFSSGMVTALCPQACLPDLGGKEHSLTLVTQREICSCL